MKLSARWNRRRCRVDQDAPLPMAPDPADLPLILARPNIASKEYWVRQYDHEVQGGSVVKPLCGPLGDGPSDGAVIMPVLGRYRAVAVAHGICPRYSDADTYTMAACAIDGASVPIRHKWQRWTIFAGPTRLHHRKIPKENSNLPSWSGHVALLGTFASLTVYRSFRARTA